MAKRIDRDKIYRSKNMPTTGDGRTGGQKPKLSQTNLSGGKDGFIAPLIRRFMGGKHQGK